MDLKSLYYQFVNFIQTMQPIWFITVWMALFAGILLLVVKFFKIYDGTQKKFEKLSVLVIALVLFAILIYLTIIRN